MFLWHLGLHCCCVLRVLWGFICSSARNLNGKLKWRSSRDSAILRITKRASIQNIPQMNAVWNSTPNSNPAYLYWFCGFRVLGHVGFGLGLWLHISTKTAYFSVSKCFSKTLLKPWVMARGKMVLQLRECYRTLQSVVLFLSSHDLPEGHQEYILALKNCCTRLASK